MPLGTLDRTPPPFFRQGPSALTKLSFCSALAIFLMVADARFEVTQPLRAAVATVLLPVQRVLLMPVRGLETAGDYFMGIERAQAGEAAAREALARQADRASGMAQLRAENARLRALLELRPALTVNSRTAEVMYEAPDLYSRKVVIDRGATDGVAPGSPVVNENGVLGQVTRVYPLSAEVTMLNDKDAAIPVLNLRTQARGAAFGTGSQPGLELRFVAGNADVQPGDVLETSGVDGVYPAGLPVATVLSVERKVDTGFARILLAPAASSDAVRHVLVLDPVGLQQPERPAMVEPLAAEAAKKQAGKGATP